MNELEDFALGMNGPELFITGTTIFLTLMVFIASGALATGIVTGIISAIGVGFVMLKMKSNRYGARLWNTMIDHPGVADLAISFGFVFLLGTTTATGIISGATAAIVSSCLITLATKVTGKVKGVPSLLSKTKKRLPRWGSQRT